MTHTHNPFFHGNPTPPHLFVGRRRPLRRIASRLVNGAQSTAIVGEPRSGKSSLLRYLNDSAKRAALLGEHDTGTLCHSVDTQALLGASIDPRGFWARMLAPIEAVDDLHVRTAFRACKAASFAGEANKQLLAALGKSGRRLTVLLDEMDELIDHPQLGTAAFFGSFRSHFSTENHGALAIVAATRKPLSWLQSEVQRRVGSPFVNFFEEQTLGALSKTEVDRILARAGDRFTRADRAFVHEVAGGHAYLVQAASSALWDAYDEGLTDLVARWHDAGEALSDHVSLTLSDTWRGWSAETRKLLFAVALGHLASLPTAEQLRDEHFYVERLHADIHHFTPERRLLRKQGFIAEDETIYGGWRIRPQAFLWWILDEVVRTVRTDQPVDAWLRAQEWDGLVTAEEKAKLISLLKAAGTVFRHGAKSLVEATAKGLAGGVAEVSAG